MKQEQLEAIVNALQAEWQCGGLGPDTMYGEFAIEVAKRERCANAACQECATAIRGA